jgi:hypothetical protein
MRHKGGFRKVTRAARPDEKPETLVLRESSSWGLMQGKVTIMEQ